MKLSDRLIQFRAKLAEQQEQPPTLGQKVATVAKKAIVAGALIHSGMSLSRSRWKMHSNAVGLKAPKFSGVTPTPDDISAIKGISRSQAGMKKGNSNVEVRSRLRDAMARSAKPADWRTGLAAPGTAPKPKQKPRSYWVEKK